MNSRRCLLIPICGAVLAAAVACGGGDDDDTGGGAGAEGGGGRDGTGQAAAQSTGDPLEIQTELGRVRGAASAVDGVRAFLTIPYAATPTGANRWRPPQPREPYDGTLHATEPGGSCPQEVGGSTARFTIIPDPVEDCLTLSVWSPHDAEDLPVMVWFHGGGLRAGSAHQPYYAGDRLAARGVVVVNVNYRLGPFGFLATEELAEESDDGSYGNYGLADQQAALEWVQANVAGFGGDAGNVTIFGESAGGGSVCAHLGSAASEGLFHKGIVQSGGGCDRAFAVQPGEEAQAAGADLLEAVGCDDIACLRDVPTDEVLAAGFEGGFVLDGVRLAESGRERAAAGELDDIPVIIGSNAAEAFLFTISEPEPSEAELRSLVGELTDDPDALLALYPAGDYGTRLDRYRDLFTDVRFTCPVLAFARAAENDVYAYHFTYHSEDERFSGIGPTHGSELAFLFAHPEGITNFEPGLAGADAAVSEAMQAAWVAFATTGEPGPGWEPYADGEQVTVIDARVALTPATQVDGDRCTRIAELR